MKKLLAGFGLLLASGCADGSLGAAPDSFTTDSTHPTVYAVTIDCGAFQCPYGKLGRYVFLERNAARAAQRFSDAGKDFYAANPDIPLTSVSVGDAWDGKAARAVHIAVSNGPGNGYSNAAFFLDMTSL
jgi:hypothetical protein